MIRAVDPFMFEIRLTYDGKWQVIVGLIGRVTVLSTCDSEREAQDVQAALVCAAAGRS